jgi:hypothetical protein
MNLRENIRRILREEIWINESVIPTSIKRRVSEESLKEYILKGELQYPLLCEDFDDGYDYADAVIDYAVRYFLSDINDDIEDDEDYINILDELRNLCRNMFAQYLVDIYEMTCSEDINEEQNESEITEKCWRGYTQKGMKTMFGKRYPNCVKKKKKKK